MSAQVGDQIFLSCAISGSPKPKMYWRRNGVKIHECLGSLETKCTYVIQRASFIANNGIYECVGENMVKLVAKPLTLEIQGIICIAEVLYFSFEFQEIINYLYEVIVFQFMGFVLFSSVFSSS